MENEREANEDASSDEIKTLSNTYGNFIESIMEFCDSPRTIKEISKKFHVSEPALLFVCRKLVMNGILETNEANIDSLSTVSTLRRRREPAEEISVRRRVSSANRHMRTRLRRKRTLRPCKVMKDQEILKILYGLTTAKHRSTKDTGYMYKIMLFGELDVVNDVFFNKIAYENFLVSSSSTLFPMIRYFRIDIGESTFSVVIWHFSLRDVTRAEMYCRSSSSAIVIFDASHLDSLKQIERILNLLDSEAGKVPILLVANSNEMGSEIPRALKSSITKKHHAHLIRTGSVENNSAEIVSLEKALMRLIESRQSKWYSRWIHQEE